MYMAIATTTYVCMNEDELKDSYGTAQLKLDTHFNHSCVFTDFIRL